jgi:GNAT superfamily N-acetyltransferase
VSGAVVRRAVEADVPALVALRRGWSVGDGERDLDPGFTEEAAEFFRTALQGGRWAIWVGEVGREVVSVCCLELVDKVPRPTREARRWGYLTNVYTLPRHRGRGFGGEMLRAVQGWAGEQELEFVIVWPGEERVGFYARQGFAAATEPLVWPPEP